MKEITLNQALLGFFIFLVVTTLLTFKIGGASNLPELVEKDGYCKTAYGDNWDYHEGKGYCYLGEDIKTFTEQEFRDVCPKNEFLSTRFYSECFYKGEPRS